LWKTCVRMRRIRAAIVAAAAILAGERGAAADDDSCPPKDPAGDGCRETCTLPPDSGEKPSEYFLAKLRSIKPTKHHIDTVFGDALLRTLPTFYVAPFYLSAQDVSSWKQNGRWAGPCTDLVAVFYSKAVEDKDPRNAVELYELRYPTEAKARRVATLLNTSWDWNYHPKLAVPSGRSVIVAEGRHRAWNAMDAVAAHLGWPRSARRRPTVLPLCDRDSGSTPVFSGAGLVLHVVGFSPSGGIAWLEERAQPTGGAAWQLRVVDLMNDREVAGRTFDVRKSGAAAFCVRHAADAVTLLTERGISVAAFPAFDKPTPDVDPSAVLIRARSDAGSEVVMQGRQGSKVLGKLPAAADVTRALGFLRSSFEARVAVVVASKGSDGRLVVRVLGGRLDKGWRGDPPRR